MKRKDRISIRVKRGFKKEEIYKILKEEANLTQEIYLGVFSIIVKGCGKYNIKIYPKGKKIICKIYRTLKIIPHKKDETIVTKDWTEKIDKEYVNTKVILRLAAANLEKLFSERE